MLMGGLAHDKARKRITPLILFPLRPPLFLFKSASDLGSSQSHHATCQPRWLFPFLASLFFRFLEIFRLLIFLHHSATGPFPWLRRKVGIAHCNTPCIS